MTGAGSPIWANMSVAPTIELYNAVMQDVVAKMKATWQNQGWDEDRIQRQATRLATVREAHFSRSCLSGRSDPLIRMNGNSCGSRSWTPPARSLQRPQRPPLQPLLHSRSPTDAKSAIA